MGTTTTTTTTQKQTHTGTHGAIVVIETAHGAVACNIRDRMRKKDEQIYCFKILLLFRLLHQVESSSVSSRYCSPSSLYCHSKPITSSIKCANE
jgi:hypothetical protein